MEKTQRLIVTAAAVLVGVASIVFLSQQIEPRKPAGRELSESAERINGILKEMN